MTRKDTKVINIGGRKIGGGSDPVDDQYKDRGCGSYGCADSCA